MAMIALKKDLAGTYKKETILNVNLLCKLHPILPELNRIIFKDNALEKPTQNIFNNLTYYLVSIISPQVCSSFTWPLYDTKAEKSYRNELSSFINSYSSKGLLSPILSSYLVNPSSYKVTVLLYQLSQLAVNEVIKTRALKESQRKLYNEMTEKYRTQKDSSFVECIDKETERILNKFSSYLHKRKMIESIAKLFRNKIKDMENKLSTLKCQEYINELVDNYLANHNVDEVTNIEILKIKNVYEKSKYFDMWLSSVDNQMDVMEDTWDRKVNPFLDLCRCIFEHTDDLIKRYTGQVEKCSYTIEYDPKTDEINTDALQAQVNSEQKFILKNIDKDGRLNFPNLLRAYLISISFILKNNEVGDEVFRFNEYLETSRRNYKEVVLGLRSLIERILNAESKLKPVSATYDKSMSITDYPEIPPLLDLSDLKINRGQYNMPIETYTPLNIHKHQFNLLRRTKEPFIKPQHRNLAPICQAPKDDFLRSLISCRISSYDHTSMANGNLNMTINSQHKVNETISECAAGFTKQQILRLLSTKKSSSSKKFRNKQERPIIKKKGALFDESILSNESNGLFRSYSSPNLFENRERRSSNKVKGRKLSIMKEDSQSQFDMTGIASLDIDSNFNTPQGIAESSRKEINTTNTPIIHITNEAEERINHVLEDMISPIPEVSPLLEVSPIFEVSKNLEQEHLKVETPQSNIQLTKKTSSLEKIINRFKKVRASVLPDDEMKTIIEEKKNSKIPTLTNKVLLPDLLSPSCSTFNLKPSVNTSYLDQICVDIDKVASRRPRESLGTALGVDQTFLDQFDLID